MRRAALVLVALVLLPPGTAGATRPGASLYAATCLRCHGTQGAGTRSGPSLRGAGALAADFYLRTGYMPLSSPGVQPHRTHVTLSEQQIDALVRYVASFGKGPAVPTPHPERGDVADGLRLFTGHCAGCHQIVAQGGYVTGAVVPSLGDATPTQIAEAVRVGPYLMPRFSKKAISDRELDSIVAYVTYTKHPDDPGGWAIGHVGPVPEGLVSWLIAGAALVGLCVLIGEKLRRR